VAASVLLSAVVVLVAAPVAWADHHGPAPSPDCVERVVDAPKFPDVDVGPMYYWDCPEPIPTLTRREAWRKARAVAIHVAYELIDEGAFDYGVNGCTRRSRLSFRCTTYFDAEGHIRCTQRYRVFRDEDGIRARYVRASTRCRRSSSAPY
jgi:hypothetical protein